VLIVDVDCTVHERTCQKAGVKGYPTIKYYMAGSKNGRDYQGGRDFNALSQFVEKTLDKAVCDVTTKKGCKDNEVTFIEKHAGKTPAELRKEFETKAAELKALRTEKNDATKEFKAKEKQWAKDEKKIQKVQGLLSQLEKAAAKSGKSEL